MLFKWNSKKFDEIDEISELLIMEIWFVNSLILGEFNLKWIKVKKKQIKKILIKNDDEFVTRKVVWVFHVDSDEQQQIYYFNKRKFK